MAHSWGHRSPWVLPRCPAWRSPWMCSSAPFADESEKSPKCSRVKQSPRGSSYIVPGARGRPGAQSSPAQTSGAARRPRRCVARPRLSRGLARAWRAQGRSLLALGRLDVSLAADPGGPWSSGNTMHGAVSVAFRARRPGSGSVSRFQDACRVAGTWFPRLQDEGVGPVARSQAQSESPGSPLQPSGAERCSQRRSSGSRVER